MRPFLLLALTLVLTACNQVGSSADPSKKLEDFVESHKTGDDTDQWIEMNNVAGEWEKTGLIFGYRGDNEECEKAIAGLKKANYAREYRCVPANQK
jgi:hypothetical protein